MAKRRTQIQMAKAMIVKHFDELPSHVFKRSEIDTELTHNRDQWKLPWSLSYSAFLQFLIEEGKLEQLEFPFPYRKEKRFAWDNVPLLEVLLTLKSDSYFTHYTAMRMQGLTEQVPKTIYLNHEQRPHVRSDDLQQGRIDAAFKRKPRASQNIIKFGDVHICMVNGMYTAQLGVVTEEKHYNEGKPVRVRLTNVERTLIDVTVRPNYGGGVAEVLKAFRMAKEKISVNRLSATLQKLNFVYPYHQAIGFYLERAGYKESSIELFRKLPRDFDFYLTYQMRETEYVKDWRLHIPRGL